MTSQPAVTLESVAFHWGDAYLLSYTRDRWVALRRDSHRFVTAGTLAGLEKAIEADYRDDPVPRAFDPPGAAGYLNLPDVDHAPDEETLIILRELRKLFPLWTITYSLQMRAWIARSQKKTICENSAALLCIALTLIERRQRQHAHGPGRHWPPPGTAPGGHANGTLAPSWFMPTLSRLPAVNAVIRSCVMHHPR